MWFCEKRCCGKKFVYLYSAPRWGTVSQLVRCGSPTPWAGLLLWKQLSCIQLFYIVNIGKRDVGGVRLWADLATSCTSNERHMSEVSFRKLWHCLVTHLNFVQIVDWGTRNFLWTHKRWDALHLNVSDTLVYSGATYVSFTLNLRVWFWLRTNAGGVLNTCKSNEKLPSGSRQWQTGE